MVDALHCERSLVCACVCAASKRAAGERTANKKANFSVAQRKTTITSEKERRKLFRSISAMGYAVQRSFAHTAPKNRLDKELKPMARAHKSHGRIKIHSAN